MIAARHFFDDIMMTRDAISVSIMLTFRFETGFTNMQFLGLAADAAEAGDPTFANLISSIQTDESRHAQIGGPALKVLIENGQKAEAQKRVDKGAQAQCDDEIALPLGCGSDAGHAATAK
jgi:toluene monooxygenase system protein A